MPSRRLRIVDPVEERLDFETLFAELSSRFINMHPGELDREIEAGLRGVCEPLGIELAALWQWTPHATPAVIRPTHVFCTDAAIQLDPLDEKLFPWFVERMLSGRPVALASLDELPPEAEVDREGCRLFGVRSNLTLPLAVGGEPPIGALGLNTLSRERAWPDALVKRLELLAQLFTNALARRRYEGERQRSEARLLAGADLAGLAFYEVDFERRDVFVDDRFRSVCGLPPDREAGVEPVEFWVERLHPDDRAHVLDLRQQLHDGKLEQLAIEYRFLHPTLGERWMHHIGRVTSRDADGRTLKSHGVFRDVTERRRAEESLRRSYEEIAQLKERLQAETDYLRAEIMVIGERGRITGHSPAIEEVLRKVEQVALTDATVLVQGETGTGKELVAQAIHSGSRRRGRVMVKVNCAALPAGLVESELFGREKGAFTGALTRQIGRFEVADGSTIFLDEVGELPLDVQSKLLRVLETGELERLGSPRTIKVDVRVIAATNRELIEEVRKGRFREDLYYRLNVFPIRVPPLRARAGDIPQLVWCFLEELSSRMGKKITQVPRRTMDALQCRPWPGNVRELRNAIERAAIITKGDTLRMPVLDDGAPAAAPAVTLSDAERAHILRALESSGWHVKGPKGAAVTLGINPATLYSRMKKLGIPLRRQADEGSA